MKQQGTGRWKASRKSFADAVRGGGRMMTLLFRASPHNSTAGKQNSDLALDLANSLASLLASLHFTTVCKLIDGRVRQKSREKIVLWSVRCWSDVMAFSSKMALDENGKARSYHGCGSQWQSSVLALETWKGGLTIRCGPAKGIYMKFGCPHPVCSILQHCILPYHSS